MFYVCWVCCHDAADFSWAAEDGGVGWGGGKNMGAPVEEAVAVFEEVW